MPPAFDPKPIPSDALDQLITDIDLELKALWSNRDKLYEEALECIFNKNDVRHDECHKEIDTISRKVIRRLNKKHHASMEITKRRMEDIKFEVMTG